MASNYKSKYVTTKSVFQWDDAQGCYRLVEKEGYWYKGPWALAHNREPVWENENFRFYQDDGFPGTPIELENVVVDIFSDVNPGDTIQLRMDHGDSGAANVNNTGTFKWQWQVDGGGWTDLGTATTANVFLINSTHLTDNTGITTQLLSGVGGSSFASGFGEEDEDNSFTSQTWSDDFGESHCAITFHATNSAAGEVYQFRLLAPDATAPVVTNVPEVTLRTPPDINLDHYRFASPITAVDYETFPLVGTEDTSFSVDADTGYALIVKLGNDGVSGGNPGWRLQYNVDAAGWNNVSASSSNVRAKDSGDSDGASGSLERLTTTSRTFNGTNLDDVDGTIDAAIGGPDFDHEFYYAIQFVPGDLTGGESITFRVIDVSGATTITSNVTPTATVGNVPILRQTHYRFATPITGAAHENWPLVGIEDTSFEITLDPVAGDLDYALIVKIGNAGDTAVSQDYQLEYNLNGGGWNAVNAASNVVQSTASGDTDNATSTTERLTTSARTFDLSVLDEVDGSLTQVWTANEDNELYYALTFLSDDLDGLDEIEFRLTSPNTIFYDVTPTATVIITDPHQEHYRFTTPITGAAHEAWPLVGVEDTSFAVTMDVDYALIIKIGADDAPADLETWECEYNVDGAGWFPITGSSTNVRSVNSGDTDQSTSLVERLTASARPFDHSELGEVNALITSRIQGDVELYYTMVFRSADLGGGETIEFRVITARHTVVQDIVPTATVVHVVTPGVGSLVLTGQQPRVDPPELKQEHYRFATPITGPAHEAWTLVGTEDVSHEIVLDDDYALIVKLANDGSNTVIFLSYQLEYSVNGGAWADVDASSSNVRVAISGDTDTATSTTERLTTSARTFVNSLLDDVNGNIFFTTAFNNDNEYEFYYAITFRSADLSGGETVTFRITSPTNSIAEDITPTATVPALSHTALPGDGSLTLTGLAPTATTTNNHVISVPVGSLATAGSIPTVAISQTAAPADGSLVATGLAPTVLVTENHVIIVPAGSLVLTGFAPTLITPVVALPATGTLVLTGLAPLAITTDNHIRAPPVGSLVLTGQVPLALTTENHIVQPGVGSLSLTGQTPVAVTTENHVVSVPTGSLTLSGQQPDVVVSITALPGVGSLVLTGLQPTIQTGDNVVRGPSTGALVLAGLAPTAVRTDNHVIAVPAGSLTFNGQVPAVLTGDDHISQPDAGSLVLDGKIPTATTTENHVIAVPAGSLSLTGSAPDAVVSLTALPGTGSLVLAGQQPTVQTGDSVVRGPNVGSLVLTGLAPNVIVSLTALPDAGSLVLDGKIPTVAVTENHVIAVPAGSLVTTGSIPTVVLTENHVVTPGVGSLTFDGKVPAAISGDNVVEQPGAGSLVLTGFAPAAITTDDHVVLPGAGSLVLSGSEPTVTTADNHVVLPGVGSLTFDGKVPAAISGNDIVEQPGAGSLVFDGKVPTVALTENHVVTPGVGSLVFDGKVPAALSGSIARPGDGSLVLTGLAPTVTVTANHVVQPGVGSLVLAGLAPTVAVSNNHIVAPGAGSLILTGLVPTIPAVTYGDIYNAVADFPTGSTVTIELFDPITGVAIALDSDACPEINADGVYIWDSTKLTTQPASYQEYAWKMTDGLTFEGGVIRINAMGVNDLMTFIMENGETFAEQMRLIRADAAGKVNQAADGTYAIRDAADGKNRIEGDDSANNGRDITLTDGT